MKTFIISAFLMLTFGLGTALACSFEFEVDEKSKKETYTVGDIVVVKVKVTFTHRVCPVAIKQTKFETNGIKVVGATDWKEVSPGVFERKLKTKITGNDKKSYTITGTRTCDKEGGFGTLTLKGA